MSSGQFNNLTRIADDGCNITGRDVRSTGPGDYLTSERRVPSTAAATTSASNPTITYGLTQGGAAGASVIDSESILRNHTIQTHTSRLTSETAAGRPQPRPFATVPYMGGGRGIPDTESRLIHSEITRSARECGKSPEELTWPVFVPLIPKIAENIQKPENIIPEVAAPGWIRSGLPSRQYARDSC